MIDFQTLATPAELRLANIQQALSVLNNKHDDRGAQWLGVLGEEFEHLSEFTNIRKQKISFEYWELESAVFARPICQTEVITYNSPEEDQFDLRFSRAGFGLALSILTYARTAVKYRYMPALATASWLNEYSRTHPDIRSIARIAQWPG